MITFETLKRLVAEMAGDKRPQWLRDLPDACNPAARYHQWLYYLGSVIPTDARIVEIGTAQGVSALHLAAGCPSGHVTTIDIDQDCAAVCRARAAQYGVTNLSAVIADSTDPKLAQLLGEDVSTIDLLFIDGNHTYASMQGDYTRFRPLMSDGGLILFDDIDYSDEMRMAWSAVHDLKLDLHELHHSGFGAALVNR